MVFKQIDNFDKLLYMDSYFLIKECYEKLKILGISCESSNKDLSNILQLDTDKVFQYLLTLNQLNVIIIIHSL